MEKNEYKLLFQLEENYWWYSSLRKLVFKMLSKAGLKKNPNKKILDVGCGTGMLLKKLEGYGNAQGIDISENALQFSRERKVKVTKASIDKIPFKNNSFDFVTVMNVLYHKKVDEKKAVRELNRVLKKHGFLLINEAAFDFLFSTHDIAVHGARRYTKNQLVKLLSDSGFKVRETRYWTTFFFIPVALIRIIKKLLNKKNSFTKSDLKIPNPFLNAVLIKIMDFESFFLDLIPVPFGVSIMILAEKN